MDRKTFDGADALPAAFEHEIERLIAAGKCKQAVELAKAGHKALNTPASEKRLVDAYLSRIEQFLNKGATQDAQTLLNLVRQRFPAHVGKLDALAMKSAAAEGNIEVLVQPLARGCASEEQRQLIDSSLRGKLTDLPRLASCAALPPEHPLRSAATMLNKALADVTSGPVTEQQIILPEISRQSPLADWKLLIRALAAFYRNVDDLCRRNLSAIPADSAVRRAADVLVAAIEHAPPLPGRAGALQARIASDDKPLRDALVRLDKAFKSYRLNTLEHAIRAALEVCAASRPELLDNLRQRISVRCAMEDVPVKAVLMVMGPARKDKQFWRLLAKSAEVQQTPQAAAAFWDRFRVHAIAEGLFPHGSMEESAVLLHAAGMLAGAYAPPSTDLRLFRHILDYYKNQPDEISRFAPKSPAEINEATDANRLFRRAVEIDPHAKAFVLWYAWAVGIRLAERQLQELAELWHRKLPTEPKPLLILSGLAEDRRALKLALRYLAQAEALDPMSADARKARLRLTLSAIWKHFKDRKPNLVQQDLAALDALPAMSEGDRPALLEAMRSLWHAIAGADWAAQAAAERVAKLAGPVVAPQVLESLKKLIHFPHENSPRLAEPLNLDPLAVAEAEARIIRLSRETDMPIYRPETWGPLIDRILEQDACPLSHGALLDIAGGFDAMEHPERAYRVSAAGLATATGANAAWFLLRRAQSLPDWAGRRAAQCLRAALELSREAQDPQLAAEIAEGIDEIPEAQDAVNQAGGRTLGKELLEEVLRAERAARKFPRSAAEAEKHVVAMAVPVGYEDGPYDDEDGEFFDGSDDPGFGDLLPNISPGMIEEIARGLGMPVPKRGEPLDPKLLRRITTILMDMLMNGGKPNEPPGRGGFFDKIFGPARRKKR